MMIVFSLVRHVSEPCILEARGASLLGFFCQETLRIPRGSYTASISWWASHKCYFPLVVWHRLVMEVVRRIRHTANCSLLSMCPPWFHTSISLVVQVLIPSINDRHPIDSDIDIDQHSAPPAVQSRDAYLIPCSALQYVKAAHTGKRALHPLKLYCIPVALHYISSSCVEYLEPLWAIGVDCLESRYFSSYSRV